MRNFDINNLNNVRIGPGHGQSLVFHFSWEKPLDIEIVLYPQGTSGLSENPLYTNEYFPRCVLYCRVRMILGILEKRGFSGRVDARWDEWYKGAPRSNRIDNTYNIQYFTLFYRSSFLKGLFLENDYVQPFLVLTSAYSGTGRETKSVCPRGNLFFGINCKVRSHLLAHFATFKCLL